MIFYDHVQGFLIALNDKAFMTILFYVISRILINFIDM